MKNELVFLHMNLAKKIKLALLYISIKGMIKKTSIEKVQKRGELIEMQNEKYKQE